MLYWALNACKFKKIKSVSLLRGAWKIGSCYQAKKVARIQAEIEPLVSPLRAITKDVIFINVSETAKRYINRFGVLRGSCNHWKVQRK